MSISPPRVSICLPNLNTRRFLPERLESIYSQTFQDWEIIVSDNYSDDGAWEYFQAEAEKEPRIRLGQAPRKGVYANWNNCLARARGEFIYIATSDDNMASDCLEKLVAALDAHPECDLAHCPLKVLDEDGVELDFAWERVSAFARSCHGLLTRPHIRQAPYDGLLHLGGETIYNSITQLLIRRSLFDRIGHFLDRWGSASDFNWGMRAGLSANCVHVPDTWAGWRVHPAQLTNPYADGSIAERAKFEEMIDDAIERCRPNVAPEIVTLLRSKKRTYFIDRWKFEWERNHQVGRFARIGFLLRRMLKGSSVARDYAAGRLRGEYGWPVPPVEVVSEWLSRLGYTPLKELPSLESLPALARAAELESA
jgi:glycosyltransferase involved in cell wall biosynthesis